MHRCEKIVLDPVEHWELLPKFRIHTVDCPQCKWRIPVPVEYVDWREIAETYEQAYKEMSASFLKIAKEAGEQFDAPFVEYIHASREALIATLRDALKRLESLEK